MLDYLRVRALPISTWQGIDGCEGTMLAPTKLHAVSSDKLALAGLACASQSFGLEMHTIKTGGQGCARVGCKSNRAVHLVKHAGLMAFSSK